jgi:ankyrin repeat protein
LRGRILRKKKNSEVLKIKINNPKMQQLKKIKAEETPDSPLYRAAGEGDLKIVKALIAEGVGVDVPDSKGRTPLFAASAGGHTEVVRYLLETGADPLRKNLEEETPLILACRSSSLATVQCLVEAGAPLADRTTWASNTPLSEASARGYLDIVEYLISKGAIPDTMAWNPMVSACANGHLEVVKCLEKHGANLQGIHGSPIGAACFNGRMEVVKYLVGRGVPVNESLGPVLNPLHEAAAGGHFEIVKYLIKCGADKSLGHENKQTPAHEAGRKGHFEIFEYLTKGFPRYRVEKIKDECAVMAVDGEDLSVLKCLLEKRECKSEVLAKCLISAIENRNLEAMEYLLGFGIDLEARKYNEKGRTFLHLAVDDRSPDVVRFLISKGANVNALSDEDVLPIHRAAKKGDVETCQILVENGADLHALSLSGKTPLAYAVHRGHLDAVDFLIEKGAKPVISEDRDDSWVLWAGGEYTFDHTGVYDRLAKAGFIPSKYALERYNYYWPSILIEGISKFQDFF